MRYLLSLLAGRLPELLGNQASVVGKVGRVRLVGAEGLNGRCLVCAAGFLVEEVGVLA